MMERIRAIFDAIAAFAPALAAVRPTSVPAETEAVFKEIRRDLEGVRRDVDALRIQTRLLDNALRLDRATQRAAGPHIPGYAPQRPPMFVCPHCGMRSYNPNDVREGYCARCHDWTWDRAGWIEQDLMRRQFSSCTPSRHEALTGRAFEAAERLAPSEPYQQAPPLWPTGPTGPSGPIPTAPGANGPAGPQGKSFFASEVALCIVDTLAGPKAP